MREPEAAGQGASPLDGPLARLLAAYSEALELGDRLGLVVVRRLSGLAPFREVPALRTGLFLKPILVNHISRRLRALRQAAHRTAALADDPQPWRAAIARIEDYEKGLSPVRARTWSPLLALLIFLSAFLVAKSVDALFTRASAGVLADVTRAIVLLDREALLNAFDEASALGIVGAAWISLYAAWIVLLGPSSSYRLKHLVVTVAPRTEKNVQEASIRSSPADGSIARLERGAFDVVGARPPRGRPLDLIAQALLIAPLLLVGGSGVAVFIGDPGSFGVLDFVLTVVFLTIGLGAAAQIAATWRGRERLRPAIPEKAGVWRSPLAYGIAIATSGAVILNALLGWVLLTLGPPK